MTTPDAPPRAPANPLLAAVRFSAFVLICLGSLVVLPWRRRRARSEHERLARLARQTQISCGLGSRAFGYRVSVRGAIPDAPCLLAPNHLGYCDIIALASVVPCFFLSKAEVGSWPLVGWCTRGFEHLFISRVRGKNAILEAGRQVKERLHNGQRLCVFLEGTSSGGDSVLPYKPTLLQPVIETGVPIVPVAMRWHSDDPRLDVSEDIAYWKDHTFVTHIFRHLGLRGKAVEITFCEPIPTAGADRQELAAQAHRQVAGLLGNDRLSGGGSVA